MLIDNKNNGKVVTELKKKITSNSKLSILSGLFSIYGFSCLKNELSEILEVRMMLSRFDDESIPLLSGSISELRLKNQLDQQAVAKECTKWLSSNISIKALNKNLVNQNLFHLQKSNGESFAIHGSSNFTASGLGETKSEKYEMNTGFSDPEATKQLLNWFNEIWEDHQAVRDIKQEILTALEFIGSDKPANLVYFITLFNIFKDYLEEIDEDSIIRSKAGFKNTLVWNKLYKFQKDGALGAIDKLERYNGCIIADSVGLGKTFEALAVIKYYELRNDRVK